MIIHVKNQPKLKKNYLEFFKWRFPVQKSALSFKKQILKSDPEIPKIGIVR